MEVGLHADLLLSLYITEEEGETGKNAAWGQLEPAQKCQSSASDRVGIFVYSG